MKHHLRALLVIGLLASLPVAALCQPAGPPPPDGERLQLSDDQRSKIQPIMDQTRAKMDALHQSVLADVRSKLTPAHFAAVQSIVQSAHPAPSSGGPPDRAAMRGAREAAAARVNATLDAGERSAVLAIAEGAMPRFRAIAADALNQTKAILPADAQRSLAQRLNHDHDGPPDAGRFLMMLIRPPRPNGPPGGPPGH